MNVYARPGSAISPEAYAVAKAASAVMDAGEKSQVLFGEKAAAISELMSIANECAKPDWDGNDASAIDALAVLKTKDFVRALPNDMALPEFAPEPDGSVSLDWIESRHRLFSLSIGRSNRLAYAWHDGADKGHGVALFDGINVPSRVLEGIRAIMSHGNTFLRAA